MNDLGLGLVISMKDMFTQNAARVQSAMTSLDASVAAASERMSRNLDRIQKGTMMIGAGLAMLAVPSALIASTAATQKALAEMASLGTKDLRTLEDAAESFTNQWAGYSKSEFIGAAYDVKSALANLSDEAVGTFSAMAALTAKATKASIQDMVGTFTTGYGIFKPIMSEMNDMEWAQAFSGAMAQTVAAFKTTGPQMAEAIKNVGATAAASNIPLQEQLAILGQLQTTMPGSEAGTLYKSFIMKAAEAGDELKLSFVDASGRLKGILPILQELKSKFPDLSQAAAQVQIKKAFGSDEAVKFVLQMSQGMEALEGNIDGIAKAMKGGTAVTMEMARAMNMDIGSQLTVVRQQLSNLFEILGGTLLPVVTPLIQGVSRVIVFFQKLARAVPFLTGAALSLSMALGAVLVVVGGVVAAAGTIGLMLPAIQAGFAAIGTTLAGVGAAVAAWFWPVTLAVAGVILAVYLLRRAWTSNFAGIRDMVVGVWDKVKLVFEGIRALTSSLSGGVGQMSAELAQKLEAAGLMGLVTTVFRVYYRVREFLAGLSEAFSHAFGRIRAILEPAVRTLLTAYGEFYGALFSVFKALGLVSTAADGASFRNLGSVIGTVLGVILQVGAYVLRFIITPLTWIIRLQAFIARAVIWCLGIIIDGFISAAKFIYKFFLPVRLLVQSFVAAGRIIYGVWQILTGDGSLLDGLKGIGSAVLDFLAEPFRWVRDVALGFWNFLTGIVGGIGRLFARVGRTILNVFMSLPIVRLLRAALAGVSNLFSGDTSLFEAGKAMIVSLGRGIWLAVTLPFTLLRDMVRGFIGIFTGENSFGEAGKGIVLGLVRGMLGIVGMPVQIIRSVMQNIIGMIEGAWQRLSALGQSFLGVIADPFVAAASLAGAAWDGINSAAQAGWDSLKTAGSGVLESLTSTLQGTLGQIDAVVLGFGSTLSSGLSGAWNMIVEGGQSALSVEQSIFNGITNSASIMAEGIRSVATGIGDAWSATFSFIRDAASATWNWVRESAAGALDSVRSGLAKAGELAGKAVSGAKELAGQAWDKTRSFGSGLWASVKSAASGAMSKIETGLGIKPAAPPVTVAAPAQPIVPKNPLISPVQPVVPPLPVSLPKQTAMPEPPLSTSAQTAVPAQVNPALPPYPQTQTATPKIPDYSPALAQPIRPTVLSTHTYPAPLEIPAPAVRIAQQELPVPEIASVPQMMAPPERIPNIPQVTTPTRQEQNATLTLIPKVETRLIPAMFQAVLMLTPVLASAIPSPAPVSVRARAAVEYGRENSVRNPNTDFLQPPMSRIPVPIPAKPKETINMVGRVQPQVPPLAPTTLPVKTAIGSPAVMPGAEISLRPILPEIGRVDIPGAIRLSPLAPVPALGIPGYLEPPVHESDEPAIQKSFDLSSGPFHPSPALARSPRQPFGDEQPGAAPTQESLRPLIETLIAKLDAMAERPIDLSVTTKIDGRQVAQAVYKDMRERKIRNYETL